MTIDLSNPIVIGVSISIISATVFGIIHYVKTLVQLNFTDKKLSNVLSELNMLHQNYKNEIADIKKRHNQDMTKMLEQTLDFHEKQLDKFIKHYTPPTSLANYNQPALTRDANFSLIEHIKNKKKQS